MTDLNLSGESYAHSLIAAGKVDRTSAWSFDAADGNALLGKNGDDWANYSRHHLGLEDSHGLQCKGGLINLDTESGKRIYGAMKERALDGLSIGYVVGDHTRGTKPNEPRRTIKTIKSLPEVSLVTFPMNELARSGAVKAADIRTVRTRCATCSVSHTLRRNRSRNAASRPRMPARRRSIVSSHRCALPTNLGVCSEFALSASSPIADITWRPVPVRKGPILLKKTAVATQRYR
jgi:Caudovirus prohead serine protease